MRILPTYASISNEAAGVKARTVQTVQATGVPLWALVVVVIGGTVILVSGTVFALIFAQRWRRRRRRLARRRAREAGTLYYYRGADGSNSSGTGDEGSWGWGRGGLGRGKLRKKRQATASLSGDGVGMEADMSEVDIAGLRPVTPTSLLATRRRLWGTLPPVLPQLFVQRFSAGFLSVASFTSKGERAAAVVAGDDDEDEQDEQVQQHRRKVSNSWVDEDAIHGPVISSSPSKRSRNSKTKSPRRGSAAGRKLRTSFSWRRSLTFRDSWPLRSMTISPTIPRLSYFGSSKTELDSQAAQTANVTGASASVTTQDDQGVRPPAPVVKHGLGTPPTSRFQHHRRNQALPHLPMPQEDPTQGYSPPRQLPKPPRQALIAASVEAAGASHARSSSWHSTGRASPALYLPRDRAASHHVYESSAGTGSPGGGSPSRSSMRGSPATRGRRVTATDTELSQILRGTEKRLQEGVVTGSGSSARRTRVSTSPPKKGALAPSAMSRNAHNMAPRAQTNESSVTLVGTASRTPSPPKPIKSGAGHARQDSQNSVMSDPDSLLAEVTPNPEHYHGLTSPVKAGSAQRQQQPQLITRRPSVAASMISDADSALSDIDERPSEDAGDEARMMHASGNSGAASMSRKPDERSLMDDPFVSSKNSPTSSERGTKGRVTPVARTVHAFNDAPRLQGGPPTKSDITIFALRSESPLSTISGNSRSPDLRPHRYSNPNDKPSPVSPAGGAKIQTPQHLLRSGNVTVYAPAPTSAVSSTSNLHRRQLSTVHDVDDDEYDNSMSVPGLSLTSPSDKDKDSPGTRRINDVRARPSSPTLGRSREKTPDFPPPSPALPRITPRLSSLYEFYSDFPTDNMSFSSMGSQRRAAGEVRKISGDSSSSSSRYSDLDRIKTNILHDINRDVLQKGEQQQQQQAFSTVRLVPPEDDPVPGVSLMVAQLRRMNSQVSTTYHSDGSAADSPVLPTLREETGRFVSPPRKREAARNYLSLGTSPRSAGKGTPGAGAGGGRYREGQNDKENERVSGGRVQKTSKLELGDGPVLRAGVTGPRVLDASTRRHLRAGEGSPERRSSDSLGLYDKDGFLISPERRGSRKR